MAPIRICAILTLALLAVYFSLYYWLYIHSALCEGSSCTVAITFMIFLPFSIVALEVITGIVAVVVAWRARHTAWTSAMAVITVVTLLGLPGSAAAPRLAAILPAFIGRLNVLRYVLPYARFTYGTYFTESIVVSLLIPVVALVYSFVAAPTRRPATT